MSLQDFKPEIVSIKFKVGKVEQTFTVRGLTADDFTHLISLHLGDMEAARVLYDRMKADVYTRENYEKFVLAMVTQAPGLVAEIISVSADEPHLAATYRRLPLPVAANALAEITRLTLEEIGGVRPFVASLTALVQSVAPEFAQRMIAAVQSLSSIGASGAMSPSSSPKDTPTLQ